jgi:hypothetical protein
MAAVLENILIMILTIAVLLGGGYLVLAILGWGLKIKSGRREEEGLTRIWAASQAKKPKSDSQDEQDR